VAELIAHPSMITVTLLLPLTVKFEFSKDMWQFESQQELMCLRSA
jgi:hypothetical protein